ncbi:hypothetical protein BDW62DRAFT_202532 [Aspergillus aurantiobrunneus]
MPPKILIVGGSITGLALANMLERHGIDYVLLEAYPAIAPQVGASIGLVANGLRILDQLGCYERLREIAGDCYKQMELRDIEGRLFYASRGMGAEERLEGVTGYPMIFIDRQMVLQVLFEHLTHKERVLTGKRAVRVEMAEGGLPRVHVQDGSVYEGDIVVGADGVHSTVRAEMWRLADQLRPDTGIFKPDEGTHLQAEARCIFGISKIPLAFPAKLQLMISGRGLSYLVTPGPGDRLYWFMFVAMASAPSRDIPRWSKEDEEALAREHFGDRITDELTFGDIYETRRATALVPLEEHVFACWHFQRIITIGDAAHKVHPLTTLGGNGAIESAALLCNALARRMDQTSTLSTAIIEESFTEVQARQVRRAQEFVKKGKQTQRWMNQVYPLSGLTMRVLIPLLGDGVIYDDLLKVALERPILLETLAVPERAVQARKDIPEPVPRARWKVWSAGILGFAALACYMISGGDKAESMLWGRIMRWCA